MAMAWSEAVVDMILIATCSLMSAGSRHEGSEETYERQERTEGTRVDETPEPVVASLEAGMVRAREDDLKSATEDEREDLEEEAGDLHGLGTEVLLGNESRSRCTESMRGRSTSDHASAD